MILIKPLPYAKRHKTASFYTANKYINPTGAKFITEALKGWPEAIYEAKKLKVENELLKSNVKPAVIMTDILLA